MATTGMEQVVEPPALLPRTEATLLTTADVIPRLDYDRLAAGVKFRSHGTQDLMREGVVLCPPDDPRSPIVSTADIRTFSGFTIYADEFCSVLAIDEDTLRAWAKTRLSAFESAQVANELLTGAATGNDCLRTVGGSAVTNIGGAAILPVKVGLAEVERELAERLHGARGMVHMDPGTFAVLQTGGGLDEEEAADNPTRAEVAALLRADMTEDGYGLSGDELNAKVDEYLEALPEVYDVWYTPSGHAVVADAGYDGFAPNGSDPGIGQSYIYGSGLAEWALSVPRPVGIGNEVVSITHDDRAYVWMRDAVVRFDPETAFCCRVYLDDPYAPGP